MSLSYEEQRVQNIKDNEALLLSLGLSTPSFTKPKPKPKPAKSTLPKKTTAASRTVLASRRSNLGSEDGDDFNLDEDGDEDEDEEEEGGAVKVKRAKKTRPSSISHSQVEGIRRSARNSARNSPAPDYTGRRQSLYVEIPSSSRAKAYRSNKRKREDSGDTSDDEDDGRLRNAQKLGVRTQDPKTFGSIPGVEVGQWWATRMDCSTDAVHAPTVAGISGNSNDGAWSVALSGGYPDDVDLGYAFTYTGSGGRDLKGTKQNPKNLRTAPQTFDQSFDNNYNAALKRSAETRLPVRVIRGFKLNSPYAPATGYRYDGLYTVERAWLAKGLTKGLKVCRYAFRRIEGQEELPVRAEEGDDAEVEGTEVSGEEGGRNRTGVAEI